MENKPATTYGNLWRDRQLWDYRKANNLCFHYGEKYEPGHAEHCNKRNKGQINALVTNDLDREISEDVLNELAIEDMITEDFCQLSLNALSGTGASNSIQLKATVQNKTMLILVDTGSSHSFVSSHFVNMLTLPTVSMPKQKVKLVNGEWLSTTKQIPKLQWFIQGQTFEHDMTAGYATLRCYSWL